MDNIVVEEEVDFLNARYSVHSKTLQCILQPFVVCRRRFMWFLVFSAEPVLARRQFLK